MDSEQHGLASRKDLGPAVIEIAVFEVDFSKLSGSATIG
jgi:hypothetical protein